MSPSSTRLPLLLALALPAACSGRLGHVHEEAVSADIPLPPEITVVRAEVQDGSLTFLPIPARRIRVRGRCHKRADTEAQLQQLKRVGVEVEVLREGTVLVLRPPGVPADADPATRMQSLVANELVLQLPSDVPLEVIATDRGHLSVQGWRAPVRLDSAHGDLALGDCSGGAKLETGGGQTLVYDHRGDLDVQARTGSILAWVDDPGDTLRLVTGSGAIQCQVPPDRAMQVEARTERGKLVNGFGLPERRLDRFGAAMEGSVGQGGTKVLLLSGAGRISLGVHR